MERAAVLSDEAALDAGFLRRLLPAAGAPVVETAEEPLLLEPAVEAVERKLILRALGAANDNTARAARLLGVSEHALVQAEALRAVSPHGDHVQSPPPPPRPQKLRT